MSILEVFPHDQTILDPFPSVIRKFLVSRRSFPFQVAVISVDQPTGALEGWDKASIFPFKRGVPGDSKRPFHPLVGGHLPLKRVT